MAAVLSPKRVRVVRGVPMSMPEADDSEVGSPLRNGRRIVGTGDADGVVTVEAGKSKVLIFEIIEACELDTLVLQSLENKLYEWTVDAIQLNTVGLQAQVFPATAYAHDATNPPSFGHSVNPRHNLQITVTNHGAADGRIVAGWRAL